MKVLFPTGSFYPSKSSGPGNALNLIIKHLNEYNVYAIVVTTSFEVEEKGIHFNKWIYGDNKKIIYFNGLFSHLRLFFRSLTIIKDVDIIHLTGLYYYSSLLLCVLSILCRKRVVWSVRGNMDDYSINSGKKMLKHFVIKILKIKFFENIYFHSTSKFETESILKAMKKKTNIIEISNFVELFNIFEVTRFEVNYFLYIGRLHSVKGVDNLINAFIDSRQFMNSNFKLLIVGHGDLNYTNYLRSLAEPLLLYDKIRFLGSKSGNEKLAFLKGAYFTIVPSISENFGNVVVESLSQGTPVIASKGTPWDVLNSTESGFWVDADSISLITVIDRIINLPKDEYQKMRSNALVLAGRFDAKINVVKWVDFYNKSHTHPKLFLKQ